MSYSIICDECTDSSNKEQLSLSVGYFANKEIHESFIGFFDHFFENHPKCQYVLNTFCDGSSKLKSLCRTRWLQRINALHIFVDLFDSINLFDQVTNNPSNWSRDSLVDATSLSKAMLNFDFIVTLHLVER